jgi:phage gp36-like protein
VSAPAPVLYATTSDLRLVLDSTDAGTGTAAQLTDTQLTLALEAASARFSTYAGMVYDGSSALAVPPVMAKTLTLDLASWWATTYYLKQKDMPATHPVALRYAAAMGVLESIRKGEIQPGVGPPGAPGSDAGHVINRIPNIFTGDDSNTAVDPGTGTLYASTPADMWSSRRMLAG